jgi:hypothetical protein
MRRIGALRNSLFREKGRNGRLAKVLLRYTGARMTEYKYQWSKPASLTLSNRASSVQQNEETTDDVLRNRQSKLFDTCSF